MLVRNIDLEIDYRSKGIVPPRKKCAFTGYELGVYGDLTDILRPAVIIFPGGAYSWISEREGEPVATSFLAAGVSAYVLSYTCCNSGFFPCAFIEALTAIQYVREHAEENHEDPRKIFLCGFSAGGHCAATAATMWNHRIAKDLGFDGTLFRPDGLILGYPVISSGLYAHDESIRNLLGNRYETDRDLVSLEKQVNAETPRTFLWHTAADQSVPVQNSLLFAKALADNGISFEMHVYPKGEHGLSTARYDVLTPGRFSNDSYMLNSVPEWVCDAIRFIFE